MKEEETEAEYYKRILSTPNADADLDRLVFGLIDKKADLGQWLIDNEFNAELLDKVIELVLDKWDSLEYMSSRHVEYSLPSEVDIDNPHIIKLEKIRTLFYFLKEFRQNILHFAVDGSKVQKGRVKGYKLGHEIQSTKTVTNSEHFILWYNDYKASHPTASVNSVIEKYIKKHPKRRKSPQTYYTYLKKK